MKVVFPKNSQGFCFGVKRAIDIVTGEAREGSVDVVGFLVHNPEVISDLSKKGIRDIATIDEQTAQKVAITAHGAPRGLTDKLSGKHMIDATCPYVKKLQKIVEDYDRDGYQVVILGDLSHPEVISVCSYATEPIVIASVDEAKHLKLNRKTALVCQTTQSKEMLDLIAMELAKDAPNLAVTNTICPSTQTRQNNARAMKGLVGVVVVVGGKMSANTKRLVELTIEGGTTTFWIERVSDLDETLLQSIKEAAFSHESKAVGLLSGASTPLETVCSIKEILEKV